MKDIIIESYIKMLKKEDLITFARKNGVELTSDEVNTIYEAIINHWRDIIHNPDIIFNQYKAKLRPEVYQKTVELYTIYKKKLYH